MEKKLIWLSHILDEAMPIYGGKERFEYTQVRSIAGGDSCNAGRIALPLHAGSHVDAPYHFIDQGKRIDQFEPKAWVYQKISLVEVTVEPGVLITVEMIDIARCDQEAELILFRTDFEAYRHESIYWQQNPGFHAECADFLKEKCPSLRAIGFDFISLSSFKHREMGHEAHKQFLSRDILIFEDLALHHIKGNLAEVIALPLRIKDVDGAPCTIIAYEV